MNIKINSLLMGLGTVYHVEQPVTGIDKAPIRESSDSFSGRDGGYLSAQFLSMRDISLKGQIMSNTSATHETHRKTLQNAMVINQLVDFVVFMPSGEVFWTQGFIRDFDMPYGKPTLSKFKIEVRCPDPRLYLAGTGGVEASNHNIQIVTVDKLDTTGFILPIILPFVITAEAQTTVTNNGTLSVSPIIRLAGKYTNPRIYNTTNGGVIQIDVSTGSGDEIIINMEDRSVKLNGVGILPYLNTIGDFFSLEVGANLMYFETASGDDATTIAVEFYQPVSGI